MHQSNQEKIKSYEKKSSLERTNEQVFSIEMKNEDVRFQLKTKAFKSISKWWTTSSKWIRRKSNRKKWCFLRSTTKADKKEWKTEAKEKKNGEEKMMKWLPSFWSANPSRVIKTSQISRANEPSGQSVRRFILKRQLADSDSRHSLSANQVQVKHARCDHLHGDR